MILEVMARALHVLNSNTGRIQAMRNIIVTAGLILGLCGTAPASLQYQANNRIVKGKAVVVAAEQKTDEVTVCSGEAMLLEAIYDAATKCIELRFDRAVAGALANTWGVLGVSADGGRNKTLWVKTPWVIAEGTNNKKVVISIEEGQAKTIESWNGLELTIQLGSGIVKSANSEAGNFSVSFLEDVRLFVKPAPTGLR